MVTCAPAVARNVRGRDGQIGDGARMMAGGTETAPGVLVTGAAGGIGSATVQAFAAMGHPVLALDVDPRVRDLAGRVGSRVKAVVADHRDLAALAGALDQGERPPVSHVVLLAGIALPEESRLDGGRGLPHPDLFRASVELNLLGHVNVLWAMQPELFEGRGDRSVTLCSSVNALQGWGEPAYSTAKAGMLGLVRALAVGYGRRGIRINAVAPGTVDTPNLRAEYEHDPQHFDMMLQGVPLGRLGRPADVAAVLLALARDLTHVTGQVIPVDGGQTAMR